MDGVLDLDFAAVARSGGTLAIYMGLATLPKLRDGLLSHGVATHTPAALIENGGTHRQRELHGTLDSVAATGRHWSSGGPALLLIGETVSSVNVSRACGSAPGEDFADLERVTGIEPA